MHEQRGPPESGAQLAARLRWRLLRATVVANTAGGVVVALVLGFFFFGDEAGDLIHLDAGLLLFGAYLAAATSLALWQGVRRSAPLWDWLAAERDPSPRERDLALRQPLIGTAAAACVWGGAALLLGAIEAVEHSAHRAFDVGLTIGLGALTTSALTFLLAERALRPAVARALTQRPPEQPLTIGVSARLVVVWALATAVPLLGLVFMGLAALALGEYGRTDLARAVVALGAVALAAGLIGTTLAAGSLGRSLATVRHALESIRAGEFDARVPVDDGSEVGLLQSGFNEMVAGLRERQLLEDLFGRHVGSDVARQAIDRGVSLGGELVDVSVFFVDLIGSTSMAEQLPAAEVVAVVNRFLGLVVESVTSEAGWVNKFEGDGALCVFAAPVPQSDHAVRASRAAVRLRDQLRVEGIDAGIGLSSGEVVAGNVGTESRYEYTVMGRPVNEAARLTDLAKQRPSRVLAAAATVRRSASAGWTDAGTVDLRGVREPVAVCEPA